MHIVTITTTTPDGQELNVDTVATIGDVTDALQQGSQLARAITTELHAADPDQPHAHLIDLNDEPHAVLAPQATTSGRTNLYATLNATRTITR